MTGFGTKCSGLDDKVGIRYRVDLMILEIFSNLSDCVKIGTTCSGRSRNVLADESAERIAMGKHYPASYEEKSDMGRHKVPGPQVFSMVGCPGAADARVLVSFYPGSSKTFGGDICLQAEM
ncbi:hypothetical protein WISP_23628 [Willisornis vidua]|uniref:Uncharacterized protein n=1 Tax=Willisornis vidua TaxID=1566151 RepID=A0ABQ9DN45_9PASS|nr:hypothetical protein WISP_23628 [Willisornis vidua]